VRTPDTERPPKAPAPNPDALLGRLRAILNHIEDAALQPATPAIAAAERNGLWRADNPSDYCTRCGHGIGPAEQTPDGCSHCRGTPLAWNSVVRLGHYQDHLRDWLLALKFASTPAIGTALGRRLGNRIQHHIQSSLPLDHAPDRQDPPAEPPPVIVPVPTAPLRRLSRGIDHTRELARGVAAATRFPIHNALAARHHRPQHRLSGQERRTNLAPAFRLRPRVAPHIAGRGVILIDDVLTTGSTARGASLTLTGRTDLRSTPAKRSPAWILLAVAAVAGHDD